MKELDFIQIIKNQIGNKYIGDDCAYLEDLGIVISQDSFVEDIHFKKEWYTPFQLGYKSVAVNISDILASGARPAYITIALSIPNDVTNNFIEEYYKGAKSALNGAQIVGGDITGCDKIFISITAIGITKGRKISSRSNAKVGYKVIAKGPFGESSKGLDELQKGKKCSKYIKAHLEPKLDVAFSKDISEQISTDYAMMDTSDGLADALFKLASASNTSIISNEIEGIYGAEDYKLVAAIPEDFLSNLKDYIMIGDVVEKQDFVIKIGNKKFYNYDKLNLFNHFGGKK